MWSVSVLKVQQGTAILERTSASIARSTAIAVETERVGTDVLGELGTQRETLTRTRDRLIDTDAELSRSKRIIRSMSRNVLYNKILLILIIILECCILGAVIYWKFFMKWVLTKVVNAISPSSYTISLVSDTEIYILGFDKHIYRSAIFLFISLIMDWQRVNCLVCPHKNHLVIPTQPLLI